MDITELFMHGMEIKERSTDHDVRALSSSQVLKAIQRHLRQTESSGRKRQGKRTYNDPTANTALQNVEVQNGRTYRSRSRDRS